MIKIRYRDPNQLSPGVHAEAKRRGRSTTVYLLSGLTTQERRAALRRLRLSARMGYCPALPAAQLALALLADRIRTGVGQAGAVFRLHPAGSTVPVMVMSGGAIAFLLLSAVSIRVLPPRTSEQRPASGPPPISAPSPGASRGPGAGRPGGPGQVGSGSGPVTAAQPGSAGSALFTSPAVSGSGTGAGAGSGTSGSGAGGSSPGGSGPGGSGPGGSSPGGSSPSSSSPGGSNSGSGTGSSPGSPSGSSPNGGSNSGSGTGSSGTSTSAPPLVAVSTTEAAVSAPAVPASPPAVAPQPQPTSAASPSSGVCLDVGPLGVCLDI